MVSTYPLVPSENIGKVNSEGVLEGSLGLQFIQLRCQFTWGISGNITYAKSQIVFIDEAKR
jgi:hypothetical protein